MAARYLYIGMKTIAMGDNDGNSMMNGDMGYYPHTHKGKEINQKLNECTFGVIQKAKMTRDEESMEVPERAHAAWEKKVSWLTRSSKERHNGTRTNPRSCSGRSGPEKKGTKKNT